MAVIRNHRRSKRYEVDGIRGSLRRAQVLEVKNLSLTGLAVESTISLPVGQVLPIRILDRLETLDMPAEVMWSKPITAKSSDGTTTARYRAGLKFTNPPTEKTREVLDFIEGHVIINIDRQMSGLFRQTGPSTQPQPPHPFLVKRIGLSGMLIEAFNRDSIPPNSLLELQVDDEVLRLQGAARVTSIGREDDHFAIRLDFQNLSHENDQALSSFIRQRLGQPTSDNRPLA